MTAMNFRAKAVVSRKKWTDWLMIASVLNPKSYPNLSTPEYKTKCGQEAHTVGNQFNKSISILDNWNMGKEHRFLSDEPRMNGDSFNKNLDHLAGLPFPNRRCIILEEFSEILGLDFRLINVWLLLLQPFAGLLQRTL